MKDYLGSVVVAAVLVVGLGYISGSVSDLSGKVESLEKNVLTLGSGSGQDRYQPENFHDDLRVRSFVQGDKDGAQETVTANATSTLTAAQVCDNSVIAVAFATNASLLTMPTGADLIARDNCFSHIGAFKDVVIYNTSGTTVLTAAASTSIQLANVTGATTTVLLGGVANLRFTRITSSSIPWIVVTAR